MVLLRCFSRSNCVSSITRNGYLWKQSMYSMHAVINFQRPKLTEGWLFEHHGGRRYFVLKGNHLHAFTRKYIHDVATAEEIFDLAIYDKAKQVSYNNNKFSLESTSLNERHVFSTETTKEMLCWLRTIQCVQQNIINPQVTFIDPKTKARSPYMN